MSSSPVLLRGFVDESSAARAVDRQEYLIGAVLIPADECDDVREAMRQLLLPGQIKLHWTDESEPRRRKIVSRICELGAMNVVVTHLSQRRAKTERFRRRCLEAMYHEMVAMEVFDLTLECRSATQDASDVEHIVALQEMGLDKQMRIGHLRGGDEPLLWIADAVLGAINADHRGQSEHLDLLSGSLILRTMSPDSLTA